MSFHPSGVAALRAHHAERDGYVAVTLRVTSAALCQPQVLQHFRRRSGELRQRHVADIPDVLPSLGRGIEATGGQVAELREERGGLLELRLRFRRVANVVADRLD